MLLSWLKALKMIFQNSQSLPISAETYQHLETWNLSGSMLSKVFVRHTDGRELSQALNKLTTLSATVPITLTPLLLLSSLRDIASASMICLFDSITIVLKEPVCFFIYRLCYPRFLDFYTEGGISHFLLTMQIITNIATATDEPLELSKSLFRLNKTSLRSSWRSSDLRCLRTLQIRELDATLIPLLFNVLKFIFEVLKKKDDLRDIFNYAWNAMLVITEQEWIISRK